MMGMRYMNCQQATNRFRPSELTKQCPRYCPLTVSPYNSTIITDSSIKKSNVATAVAHIWEDYSIINQLKIQTMNITTVETELMAIHCYATCQGQADGV